jgi:hypothetical protein
LREEDLVQLGKAFGLEIVLDASFWSMDAKSTLGGEVIVEHVDHSSDHWWSLAEHLGGHWHELLEHIGDWSLLHLFHWTGHWGSLDDTIFISLVEFDLHLGTREEGTNDSREHLFHMSVSEVLLGNLPFGESRSYLMKHGSSSSTVQGTVDFA